MAYCEDESFYQEDDYGEFFNLYPQDGTFQFAQTLPSMASFGHENSIYTLFQNNPPLDYGDYDSAITFSADRCSASSFSQPLLIQYDPSSYDGEFNPNSTKFVVSYSVSEFGEPEFEEFNPTPYAGGYDPAQTYGKPLPATSEFFNLYPQDGTFQFAQTLPSMASFGHENSIYTLFQNNPPRDYGDYDSAITFSAARCSASSFSQPLLIQYDPSLYDGELNPNSTKFVVSYSVSEFGEPEFEEFNPTPYAGGYDPAQTYGKPLPATSEICHPRSQAGPVSGQGSNGSAALSKEKEESFEKEVKPPIEKEKESRKTNDVGENGGNKEAVNEDGSVKVPQISQIPTWNGLEAIDEEEEEEEEEEESEEETYGGGENGGNREAVNENEKAKVPQISKIPTEYKPEAIDEDEEGEETSDGGENGEAQISQIPSGYGLEAMDLCESLFGYWPCLSKMNKERDERENGCREIHENQWSMAADYFFGSSDPYAAMADEGRSSANPICCYDRHHQLQSYHGYAENC